MEDETVMTREEIVRLIDTAFQAIVDNYKKYPEAYKVPYRAIFELAGVFEWNQDKWLATFIRAYGLHVQRGQRLEQVWNTMRDRAYQGHSWRAVVLWSYKANRNPRHPC